MILPVREIRNEVLSHFNAQVFPVIRVEALPLPDRLEVDQSNGEQLLAALLDLGIPSLANLGLHPLAIHAVLRKYQEQLVSILDGLADLLVELLACLDILGREPDLKAFGHADGNGVSERTPRLSSCNL